MKTLLLSLIGIVGSTSSSIIAVALSNQHNVNQIKTSEVKLTKDFSYNLDTNYPDKTGGKKYDHSKEFSNFIHDLQTFIKDNKIKDWQIAKGWSKFGKVKKQDFNSEVVDRLNKRLHGNNITDINQFAEVDGPYDAGRWRWFLRAKFESDGELFDYSFDAYHIGSVAGEFTEAQLASGFTNTFTIEYEAGDKIDISAGNFKESPVTEMKFLTTDIDDFKNNITLNSASAILQDSGYTVKPEWLTFKEAIWLETNETITDDLLQGKLGAGQYHFKVTVETSKLGIENNVVGEMTFFMTLKYEYGDLSAYNNHEINRGKPIELDNYKMFITAVGYLVGAIGYTKEEYAKENALALSTVVAQDLVLMGDIYDSVTNKKFTEDDFLNLPEGSTKSLYTFAYPAENGKKLGILNTAKLFMTLYKGV